MTQIVIIGAGVIGTAIAYELSRIPDYQITLLEQAKAAGGATGASLGVMMGIISQKNKGRAWKLRQATLQRFDGLITELETLTGQTIAVNRQGIVMLFQKEEREKWQALQQKRADQGYLLEYWSTSQLQDHCPQIVTTTFTEAIYSPGDRQVNPTQLTEVLLAAARLQGVDYRPNVTVEGFQHRDGICGVVETSAGLFKADQVIMTAGLGSLPLTQSLEQPVPLQPVLGQALRVKCSQPLGNADFQPVITGDDVHIVPWGQDKYAIGATVEFPSTDGALIADPLRLETVYEQAIAFCPGLVTAEIVETWSGQRPQPTTESAPILRPLTSYQNVLLATGHYRNGILLAPATALWVKDYLLKL